MRVSHVYPIRLLFNLRYLRELASHQPEQTCYRTVKMSRSRLSPTSPNLPHGRAQAYERLTSGVLAFVDSFHVTAPNPVNHQHDHICSYRLEDMRFQLPRFATIHSARSRSRLTLRSIDSVLLLSCTPTNLCRSQTVIFSSRSGGFSRCQQTGPLLLNATRPLRPLNNQVYGSRTDGLQR